MVVRGQLAHLYPHPSGERAIHRRTDLYDGGIDSSFILKTPLQRVVGDNGRFAMGESSLWHNVQSISHRFTMRKWELLSPRKLHPPKEQKTLYIMSYKHVNKYVRPHSKASHHQSKLRTNCESTTVCQPQVTVSYAVELQWKMLQSRAVLIASAPNSTEHRYTQS